MKKAWLSAILSTGLNDREPVPIERVIRQTNGLNCYLGCWALGGMVIAIIMRMPWTFVLLEAGASALYISGIGLMHFRRTAIARRVVLYTFECNALLLALLLTSGCTTHGTIPSMIGIVVLFPLFAALVELSVGYHTAGAVVCSIAVHALSYFQPEQLLSLCVLTTTLQMHICHAMMVGMVVCSAGLTMILFRAENSRAQTQLGKTAGSLTKYIHEINRSNKELEQFAYIASHDLQEPLRMVTSYLGLIKKRYDDKLDKDGREFIGFAVDGAARMRQLINDLLLYSRVGTRGKPFTACDMNTIFAQSLKNLEVAVQETGASVTTETLPTIYADHSQMTQLLQNLIGNALKFRGDDTPVVSVSAERRSDAWEFRVKDNGIGIPPDKRDRIFQIFQRLHTRKEYDGTGIGLAVCKRIVERHGGSIGVDSTPENGSSFHFTIPDKPHASEGHPSRSDETL